MPPKPNDVVSAISSQTPSVSSPVLPKSQPAMMGNDKGKGKKKPVKKEASTRPAELSDEEINYESDRFMKAGKETSDFNDLIGDLNRRGLTVTSGGYRKVQKLPPNIDYQALMTPLKGDDLNLPRWQQIQKKIKVLDNSGAQMGDAQEALLIGLTSDEALRRARKMNINSAREFDLNKNEIFKDLLDPRLSSMGYYNNLINKLGELYQEKNMAYKPLPSEQRKKEIEDLKKIKLTPAQQQIESKYQESREGVLPKSSK